MANPDDQNSPSHYGVHEAQTGWWRRSLAVRRHLDTSPPAWALATARLCVTLDLKNLIYKLCQRYLQFGVSGAAFNFNRLGYRKAHSAPAFLLSPAGAGLSVAGVLRA